MKKSIVLFLATFSILFAVQVIRANTIADWTFETSQPGVITLPAAPGAGVAFTGFSPEIGSGTASALHAGASTYSSPDGNGSSHSFSSTVWTVGDYYQFSVSSVGFGGIQISFDQTSSGTGPGVFGLFYSVNGGAYAQFGANYSVLANASPNPVWNGTTSSTIYTSSFDLSSLSVLNNDTTVSFRLVDELTNSAGGGTVGTAGSDRVDNFVVTGTAISAPEQTSTFVLAVMGISACLVFRRSVVGIA